MMIVFFLLAAMMTAVAVVPVLAPLRSSRRVGVAVAGVVCAGGLGLYLWLGDPLAVERQAVAPSTIPSPQTIAGRVAALARRVQDNPQDAAGWRLLATSYVAMERYDLATDAYRRLLALQPDNAEAASALGEAMAMADGGLVGQQAQQIFQAALALAPDDPRARFYLGLAARQAGDLATAKAYWSALLADSPPDAPWMAHIRQQLQEIDPNSGR